MTVVLERELVQLHHGACLDVLRADELGYDYRLGYHPPAIPTGSVDAVVTDPPYGLANTTPTQVADTIVRWVNGERDYLPGGKGFMGKEWDAFVPPVAVWDECLRVLKPGGHVLAFAGTRTIDLMSLGIRLAGFDVRDSLAWLYGSGFPKSLDVPKAIERELSRDMTRELEFTAWMRTTGITSRQIDEATGTNMGGHYLTAKSQPAIPTAELLDMLRPLLPEVPQWIEDEIAARETAKAESRERNEGASFLQTLTQRNEQLAVARDEAKEWEGWGTALKPAFEPIVVGRKPLGGTVAANVLAHGTGALNIDGCRIGGGMGSEHSFADDAAVGRWPANVILDESQADELDAQSGVLTSGVLAAHHQRNPKESGILGAYGSVAGERGYGDTGGASRFFYVAKPDGSERVRLGEVAHPTVKPLSLMRWLVRLVTPPGGTVLEPFAGSGTTVEACVREGFRCVAVEREAEYLPLIERRIDRQLDPIKVMKEEGEDLGFLGFMTSEASA